MAIDPKRVLKPVRKLRKLLKNMSAQPSPEQVHDLRTNSRRLEAILTALSPDAARKHKQLLKDVATLRKKAGKVRDMDVLIDYAAGIQSDGEGDCRVQLLQDLGASRKVHGRKLQKAIKQRAGKTRARLKQASAQLEKVLCADGERDCDPAVAPAQATASALKLESELFEPARLSRANLHPYRLKVKELHNVLRVGENAANRQFIKALSSVKDAIGEWHDWEELLAIAKDVLDHPNCKLLRDLQTTAQNKYEQALNEALSMRRKYLRMSDGKPSRKQDRTRDPGWTAITALAA